MSFLKNKLTMVAEISILVELVFKMSKFTCDRLVNCERLETALVSG